MSQPFADDLVLIDHEETEKSLQKQPSTGAWEWCTIGAAGAGPTKPSLKDGEHAPVKEAAPRPPAKPVAKPAAPAAASVPPSAGSPPKPGAAGPMTTMKWRLPGTTKPRAPKVAKTSKIVVREDDAPVPPAAAAPKKAPAAAAAATAPGDPNVACVPCVPVGTANGKQPAAVSCRLKGCGCPWMGKRADELEHVANDCGFVTVVCPKCDKEMPRRDLAAHYGCVDLCEAMVSIECPFGCGHVCGMGELEAHKTECLREPTKLLAALAILLHENQRLRTLAGVPGSPTDDDDDDDAIAMDLGEMAQQEAQQQPPREEEDDTDTEHYASDPESPAAAAAAMVRLGSHEQSSPPHLALPSSSGAPHKRKREAAEAAAAGAEAWMGGGGSGSFVFFVPCARSHVCSNRNGHVGRCNKKLEGNESACKLARPPSPHRALAAVGATVPSAADVAAAGALLCSGSGAY